MGQQGRVFAFFTAMRHLMTLTIRPTLVNVFFVCMSLRLSILTELATQVRCNLIEFECNKGLGDKGVVLDRTKACRSNESRLQSKNPQKQSS